ncbi:hypothetical protein CSUB01_04976 [Colletotrichum sublineola]|uniref:Uncharacterized protein n=1 Tax=Colletotrichum sublineola TaxID=1173701 RepID=A0A066X4I6_COLSU|nr:hypothetical protein CSUB01_04976 [Colletotrichum sublineola]
MSPTDETALASRPSLIFRSHITKPISQRHPRTDEFMSIENLKSYGTFDSARPPLSSGFDADVPVRSTLGYPLISIPGHVASDP